MGKHNKIIKIKNKKDNNDWWEIRRWKDTVMSLASLSPLLLPHPPGCATLTSILTGHSAQRRGGTKNSQPKV